MPTTVRRTRERLALLHLIAESGPLTQFPTLTRVDSLMAMQRAGLLTSRGVDERVSNGGRRETTLEFSITAAGRTWLAAARATATTRRIA